MRRHAVQCFCGGFVLTRQDRPLRVLVVEDHALIALDLKHLIGEMGGTVVGAPASAEQGLELARTLRPDIVLMDVRLAGVMDGIDAAQALPGTALVFITGNTDAMTM